MEQKRCFKCDSLLGLDSFYAQSSMRDGHVNKCKTCTKRDVSENYFKNREHYVAYYAAREKTSRRKEQRKIQTRKARARHPEKDRARRIANQAVLDGRLSRQPCEKCGSWKHVHKHHDDYAQPLAVRWLCTPHHFEHHAEAF